MFESKERSKRGTAEGFKKLGEYVCPKTNYDLYFVGMLRREAETLGARDISSRLCIISANLLLHQPRIYVVTERVHTVCGRKLTCSIFESQGLHRHLLSTSLNHNPTDIVCILVGVLLQNSSSQCRDPPIQLLQLYCKGVIPGLLVGPIK